MEAKLIGYKVYETPRTVDYDDHECYDIVYTFYVEINGECFSFEATESHGSCGSGYTSASWASMSDELNHSGRPTNEDLVVPIKDIFINVLDDKKLIKGVMDSENSWDATVSSINTTEGEFIVSESGNGGCDYYSSGCVCVNDKLFQQP